MRIKVDTRDLTLGMYVAELDRPWLDSPFLFQGFTIEDPTELEKLRQVCRWVKVDDNKSNRQIDFVQVSTRSAERQADHFVEVAGSTAKLSDTAVHHVDALLEHAQLGEGVEPGVAHEVVAGLVHAVTSNTNAALWRTGLKKRNARAAGHCLNTSIIALAFAQYLGEPIDTMQDIGTAALLHDIGLGKVPKFIVDKPGMLVDAERQVVQQHPIEGHKMLASTRQLSPKVLEIIRDHHERVDGSGYPRGIRGDAIDRATLIVAIADTYDAMTTDQPWRKAMLPQVALTTMTKECAATLDKELVRQFIRCMGIYPTGSLVRLNDASLAVVLSSDEETRLKPMVLLVRDGDGDPVFPHRICNLQAIARARPQDPLLIVEMLDPASHGIDVQAVVAGHLGLRM